jgi:lysylphosphatidylglycerol synthetase-like protein (DUF2156 family)
MTSRTITGAEARALGIREKWTLLSPHLRRHGREALSYATLQEGMEYFIHSTGYIAFNTVTHPVFARKARRIVLSDPICAREDLPHLVRTFLSDNPRAAFAVVSEACAEALRVLGFKANCVGYEPEIPVQTYNTKGNWKELDLIKRARNEAKREGLVIREERDITKVSRDRFDRVTAQWIASKRVNDREIWLYARRPVFEFEEDVRKFVAYDKDGQVAGFVFYDPMYREGRVVGYAASISRCDEKRFSRLATAIHMEAVEVFRTEGVDVLNLCLAPFGKLQAGKFNDDSGARIFFQFSERYGDNIYNFKGLAFYKSKYRGVEKSLYFASNNAWPANDVYLAFLCSDITRSYFSTVARLLWGMLTAWKKPPAPQT